MAAVKDWTALTVPGPVIKTRTDFPAIYPLVILLPPTIEKTGLSMRSISFESSSSTAAETIISEFIITS